MSLEHLSQPLFKKMIKGHGIDIEEISSIQKVYEKNARFAKKVLTVAEFARFEELSGRRKNGIFGRTLVC